MKLFFSSLVGVWTGIGCKRCLLNDSLENAPNLFVCYQVHFKSRLYKIKREQKIHRRDDPDVLLYCVECHQNVLPNLDAFATIV